jgi:hypothetical protein
MSFVGFMGLVLLAAGPQDPAERPPVTISKQERSIYIPVFERYREAEALLPADPLDCANRCAELIKDPAIKDGCREAKVRVQNTDGSYGEWSIFAPYQLRGRALVLQAREAAKRDRKESAALAQAAITDLKESLRRGLKSSDPYLKEAEEFFATVKEGVPVDDVRRVEAEARIKELRGLRGQKGALEALLKKCEESAAALKGTSFESEGSTIRANAFRELWTQHVEAERFRSAGQILSAQGAFLSAEDRIAIRLHIEDRCRRHVASAMERFRTELRETLPPDQAWATLSRLTGAEFERRFALPEEPELLLVHPELEWGRLCRERLRKVRSVEAAPNAPSSEFRKAFDEASQAALDAVPLAKDGQSRAFAALELLAHNLARLRLERELSGAAAAAPESLQARRQEVSAIVASYDAFAGRVEQLLAGWPDRGEAFRRDQAFSQHAAQVREYPSLLPVDLERVDQIAAALFNPSDHKGIWGRTAQLALDYEFELAALEQSRLSRECRRKLDTCLLVAGISRLLLSGLRGEEIARREELQKVGRRLEDAGGPLPEMMSKVGPKVRVVAERLRR